MAEEINTPEAETPEASSQVVAEAKVLTQEQVDKVIQERIAREREKLATDFEQRLKAEREEAQRLAELSAEEKEKEMMLKHQKELEAKARDVAIRENRLMAVEKFAEAKIPTKLVDYVVREDAEETSKAIEDFMGQYQKAVADGVADKIKGTPPKDVGDTPSKPVEIKTTF